MTLTAAVAAAYLLPEADVARWPGQVVRTFYLHAIRAGWLLPTPTPEETP